ncbi:MAG: DUF2339 domain-containing protein [Vicingaceae bacterium]
MTGLITVLLIVVVIFFFKIGGKINVLNDKVDFLIREAKKESIARRTKVYQQVVPPKETVKEEKVTEAEKKPVVEKPIVFEEKSYLVNTEDEPIKVEQSKLAAKMVLEKASVQSEPPKKAPESPAPPKPSFMERNPDLERFIGENLLSKIGIVIFVIGMGFLIKLGIDSDVITESMRVAIGIVIGGGMIGLAHKLRVSFARFSSILIGGALAVLYFTIALAFHEYHLIPQIAAFVIMVLITCFAVLLAIAYDRKELAVLALIDGFESPFFLSTGSGNIAVLFTYILILDIGMLALVYFRKWNIVNYLIYGFTYLLFVAVYLNKYAGAEELHRTTIFMSLTAFYLILFLMTIVYNVKNKVKFRAIEIAMLLSNSALYFGFGLAITNGYKAGLYNGLFTTLVAIFNFVFSYVLYKRNEIDKNLLFLLIGLVLTFMSLVAPIQLDGNYITLFWAVEAVLLLWLSKKGGIEIMKASAFVVLILMLFSLAIDWQQNYYPKGEYIVLSLFLNKVFITGIVALGSLFGIVKLLEVKEQIQIKGVEFLWKKMYVKTTFAIVLFFSFYFELKYQFVRFEYSNFFVYILLGVYNYAFILGLLAYYRVKKSTLLFYVNAAFSSIAILSYITYYLSVTSDARDLLLRTGELVSSGFYWHYVLFGLFLVILINLTKEAHNQYGFKSKEGKIALWILSFLGIFICSAEVGHLSLIYQSGSELSSSAAYKLAPKSVYPVVWALSALVLMILGMKFRLKTLRVASLVLFSITIVKLFFYDLAGNSTGKILSFILLGVILLLISFLYQKLKFIIQDDKDEKNV